MEQRKYMMVMNQEAHRDQHLWTTFQQAKADPLDRYMHGRYTNGQFGGYTLNTSHHTLLISVFFSSLHVQRRYPYKSYNASWLLPGIGGNQPTYSHFARFKHKNKDLPATLIESHAFSDVSKLVAIDCCLPKVNHSP